MANSNKRKGSATPEIRNSAARHHYHIGDTYEAGIMLLGTEVKSVRAGKAQLHDAFCRIDEDGVPTLYHSHIEPYALGTHANHVSTRPRKLLLKQREIDRIRREMETGGQALIPLRLYFVKALIKVEVALATGKKLFDKRETLKRKTESREAERAVRDRN